MEGDGLWSEWNPRQVLVPVTGHRLNLRFSVSELKPGLRHTDS